ncbi:hypothetical protein [uncultured Sulfitobacter sp.]|uniref:hypothetical protein n=1 Tax=uncultured Sulfitobacter sp. TaxID=191468 RepID=UPI00260E479D|nr:hypothetical protein [uncultured Sulfitobacter sp.]
MPTLWLFDIEPHEQRYTSEWQKHLPPQLRKAMSASASSWDLQIISGIQTTGNTTPGAFLNFAESTTYKAAQIAKFSAIVQAGGVTDGDRLLFTDAWHLGVIQCRYMADLLDIDLSIDVMWHAGSYDPWDILARKITDQTWSRAFEVAVYCAADRNYFATSFHRDMFLDAVGAAEPQKAQIVGWPMEYLGSFFQGRREGTTKDTILFPHRISPEKQPEIMQLLEPMLPEYRVCFAQEKSLTKQQYHEELARSVAVFSANQQETLGIGVYEGLLNGAVPIVPHRLSYPEVYPTLGYPSDWTTSLAAAGANAANLIDFIHRQISDYTAHSLAGRAQWASKFFNGSELYASVLR